MQTKMVSCGTRASARLPPHVLMILGPGTASRHSKARHSKASTARQSKQNGRQGMQGKAGNASKAKHASIQWA